MSEESNNTPVPHSGVTRLPDSVPDEMTAEQLNQIAREQYRQNRNQLRLLGFDFNLTYYLCGPMSGYHDFNYGTFGQVAHTLRMAGLAVESPHENPWPLGHEAMDPEELWGHMMKLCATQMDKCDGIIVLTGWPQSRGARQEMRRAIMKGWPVWYYDTENHMVLNMNKPGDVVDS